MRVQFAEHYINPTEATQLASFFEDLERLKQMLAFIRHTSTIGAMESVPMKAADLCKRLAEQGPPLVNELERSKTIP